MCDRSRQSFVLSPSLSETALQILLRNHLGDKRSPEALKQLVESREAAAKNVRAIIERQEEGEKAKLEREKPLLLAALRYSIAHVALSKFSYGLFLALSLATSHEVPFSSLDKDSLYALSPEQKLDDLQRMYTVISVLPHALMFDTIDHLDQLLAIHPATKERLAKACEDRSFTKLNRKAYTDKKEGILLAKQLLTNEMPHEQQQELVKKIFEETPSGNSGLHGLFSHAVSGPVKLVKSYINGPLPTFDSQPDQPSSLVQRSNAKREASQTEDSGFLSQLSDLVSAFPILADVAGETVKQAQEHFKETLEKHVDRVASLTEHARLEEFKQKLKAQVEIDQRQQEDESRGQFLADVKSAYLKNDSTEG